MGYKVFVSYKYSDENVRSLYRSNDFHSLYNSLINPTTARDYVNEIEKEIGESNIYKGEHDNEDLSYMSDDFIEDKLKNKIYDSTITIVLITPNMIDRFKTERNQWIPWEISYSLKEITRNDRTSRTNGIICVLIPDKNNSYDYVLNGYGFNENALFPIIKNNMYNIKKEYKNLEFFDKSYIIFEKWDRFIANVDLYLSRANSRIHIRDMYELSKLTSDTFI